MTSLKHKKLVTIALTTSINAIGSYGVSDPIRQNTGI
jgi:hypothetical protein